MANFFKDYQAEIRRKREREHAREIEQAQAERARRDYLDGLERGDKVKYSVLVYAGTETPQGVAEHRKGDLYIMKIILYKTAEQGDKVCKGERVTVSERNGKITVSTFLDFIKSGLTLATREDMTFWGLDNVINSYTARGYVAI